MREYDSEPVRGLPEALPAGERILWQGSPDWRSLARHAFHVRKIAVYCAVLVAWRIVSAVYDGEGMAAIALIASWMAGLTAVAVALPLLFGWLYARTTVYTITSHRVVIRAGVALPMALNLPFKTVAAASVRSYADGTGDLPLTLAGLDRIAYLHLWPNARPWRLARPEPMLRSVAEAGRVAGVLGRALAAAADQPALAPREETAGAAAGPLASAAA